MTPARIEPAGSRDLDSLTALLDSSHVQQAVEFTSAWLQTAQAMVREVER